MSYLVGEDRYQSTFMPRSLDELIDLNRTFTAYFTYTKNNHQYSFNFNIQEDDYKKYIY